MRPEREGAEISVPASDAPYEPEIVEFALTYNAYDRHGGFDGVAAIGNETLSAWEKTADLPEDLDLLRCALFFEQRRYRHFGSDPAGESLDYIQALVEAIGRLSGGSVPGPGDPFP